MRNTHFAVATHILIYLSIQKESGAPPSSSSEIARSVNTHDTFIRQVLARLTCAGWVASRPGRGGGYHLTTDPDQITLRQVHQVVVGHSAIATHNNPPSQSCAVGRQIIPMLDDVWQQMAALLEQQNIGELSREVALREGLDLRIAG